MEASLPSIVTPLKSQLPRRSDVYCPQYRVALQTPSWQIDVSEDLFHLSIFRKGYHYLIKFMCAGVFPHINLHTIPIPVRTNTSLNVISPFSSTFSLYTTCDAIIVSPFDTLDYCDRSYAPMKLYL